jgi:hypothetical protein
MDEEMTSGTSDFEESNIDNEPDDCYCEDSIDMGTLNFNPSVIMYKRWSTVGKGQYSEISAFWNIVEKYVHCSRLQGFGCDWTDTDFLYGIIFLDKEIPEECLNEVQNTFPDITVEDDYPIPDNYEYTYEGETKNLDPLYDEIWSKGPLAYELEEFTDDGHCKISVIRKQPIQESYEDDHRTSSQSTRGWRVTYQGTGIYEALKKAMFDQTGNSEAWLSFIKSDACKWLPTPPSYGSNNASFFTEKGINKFNELVLPIVTKYIDQKYIKTEELSVPSNQIVYSDEFQFIIDNTISKTPRSNTVYTTGNVTKIEDFPFDKAYFGSPNKLPSTMKLDGPFFITPYIGAASIFAVRPQHLQKYGVPRGISINRAYKEWDITLKDTLLQEPLKEVHVILQGAPDIKESVENVSGYIYTVDITPDIRNHIYQSDKMDKDMEFCIDKLDTIDFSNIQEVTVKMTVSGAPVRIKDICISYAMGVDNSIYELTKEGFRIKEDDGDYEVMFDYSKKDIWEEYINTHIKDTYWNEYINLSTKETVFMIKENNQIKRVVNHNFENDPELLSTCNRLCEGDFKSIKELILSNDFYKRILTKNNIIQESNTKKVGFNMIISEVLDAIDNINSTSISNEINVCESLLISYDKMSVIIENCNDTSYDEFQIIQEGSKLDALKEDFKKQNEGKSTINKIIFAIPRLLRSLFRLITGKLKKCEDTLETIDDTIKKNKSKAKAGQIISLFAALASGAFYMVYMHQTFKEVSSTKYGESQSLGSFLKMIFKEEMPSIYKAIIKTENKIKSVKKVHNIKNYIKKHEKEKKSIDNNEFNISKTVEYAFEEFDAAFATKNIFYSNKLFAVITNEKLEPMIRAAAIEEFEVINDDLISSLKYIIKQMESVQDEEIKQAIENTGDESFARYEAESISKIKELLKEREAKKTHIDAIKKQLSDKSDKNLEALKSHEKNFKDNIQIVKTLCKKYSSRSKFAYDFTPDINDGCWCLKYNITKVINDLMNLINEFSTKIDKLKNTKDSVPNPDTHFITQITQHDIIVSGDSTSSFPVREIGKSIEENKSKYE